MLKEPEVHQHFLIFCRKREIFQFKFFLLFLPLALWWTRPPVLGERSFWPVDSSTHNPKYTCSPENKAGADSE